MTPLRLALVALVLAAGPASARGLSSGPYDIYIERQRGRTVVLEHSPVPPVVATRVRPRAAVVPRRARPVRPAIRRVAVRRAVPVARAHRYRGIAGGCRDGGYVRRVVAGTPVLLQSEVCRDIDIRLR